jgi:hypothetical protein
MMTDGLDVTDSAAMTERAASIFNGLEQPAYASALPSAVPTDGFSEFSSLMIAAISALVPARGHDQRWADDDEASSDVLGSATNCLIRIIAACSVICRPPQLLQLDAVSSDGLGTSVQCRVPKHIYVFVDECLELLATSIHLNEQSRSCSRVPSLGATKALVAVLVYNGLLRPGATADMDLFLRLDCYTWSQVFLSSVL